MKNMRCRTFCFGLLVVESNQRLRISLYVQIVSVKVVGVNMEYK